MEWKELFKIIVILRALSAVANHAQEPIDLTDFTTLTDVYIRHAHLRCLQQFPRADTNNYTNTMETQCFLHCFLYKAGLMDLSTRGLNDKMFFDIWEKIQEAFVEDTCLEKFDFGERLSGNCSDSYRKIMEFRKTCVELFEYTFNTNTSSTWKSEDSKHSKKLGQSATEFCDRLETKDIVAKERSEYEEIPLLSQYKSKLKCIFENIYYLDAYGRIDEAEIILSYQEARDDSLKSRAIIRTCSHRANSKFLPGYLGNTVLELKKCLKAHSTVFDKVFKLRDETSRQY